MGVTSENVAERFGIGRKDQDEAAVSDAPEAFASLALWVLSYHCLST